MIPTLMHPNIGAQTENMDSLKSSVVDPGLGWIYPRKEAMCLEGVTSPNNVSAQKTWQSMPSAL